MVHSEIHATLLFTRPDGPHFETMMLAYPERFLGLRASALNASVFSFAA
jgi:hypothetical protein